MSLNDSWMQRDLAVLWHPCTQMKDHEQLPLIPIRRGEGVWLEDFDGKRYLDAVSSWWTSLFGHAEPRIGAAIAATVKVFVPTAWMQALTSNVLLEAAVLSLLAVIVALCSEADAFMAVSLTSFSPTAQLAFLAIGPVVDVKLMAVEGGAFGAGFLRRFVPLATCCCFLSALLIGTVIFPS